MSGLTHNMRLQQSLYEDAYKTINTAIDQDQKGMHQEALRFYLISENILKEAMSIAFSQNEWDGGKTRAVNSKMQRYYKMIKERIEDLKGKLGIVCSDGSLSPTGRHGWTPSFSNDHLFVNNPNAKRPVIQTRDLGKPVNCKTAPMEPRNPAHRSVVVGRSAQSPSIASPVGVPALPKDLKAVPKELRELIINEIVDNSPKVTWDDVVGLEYAKQALNEMVILPFLRPDIFNGLREPPRGVLLFGPPGTGKTMLAKAVATESKSTFFSTKASTLVSKYMGESEKLVRALFGVAHYMAPSIIFIDEIDSLLSERSDSEHEATRRLKNEFLIQIDGLNGSAVGNKRVLVMGATNRPQDLDEAARRRLQRRIYIPLPDTKARKFLILKLLQKQPARMTEAQINAQAEKCEGYSASDIVDLVREAALFPVRQLGAAKLRTIEATAVRPIIESDFADAFHRIRPSVSKQSLKAMHAWNRKYGSGT